jgi:hypothetical protein
MSRIRPFAWLAALLAVVGWAAPAAAQHFQPFLDPGYFEPDFQFFAPAEVSEFGCGEPPNTGVYFGYDRVYAHVSRPDGEASFFSEHGMDKGWGNRYEIGYMTEERSGWQLIHWHMGGPNVHFTNAQDIVFVDGQQIQTEAPINYSRDSINALSMTSLEVNKVWRRKQFHNGAILEPLVGFRHIHFKDFYRREELDEIVIDPPDEVFVIMDRDTAQFSNACFGGQLGGRLFWTRSHWTLSADVRFFALANFQQLKLQQEFSILSDDGDLEQVVEIVGPDYIRSRSYDQASMFVWGGEVRTEAAYELTRDISLRFGFVFLDLGQGIGRGNNIRLNNQDVQMAGMTFGVTINR